MQVEDIEADLQNRNIAGLEDAFRALVADEDVVDPMDLADDATDLLMRVCDALQADRRIMPRQVVTLIRDETDGALTNTTYAGGAAAVKAHVERWRAGFEAKIGRVA